MSSNVASRPKEIIGYHYNPGKKVFLVSVEVKNGPGGFASIASMLPGEGINMLGGFMAAGPEKGTFGFFAESERGMRSAKLKEIIDSSPYVLSSTVIEGTEGLVVDALHFPIKLNSGETMILARREVFSDMFRRLGEIFGTGGETIVYEEGEATGESDGRRLVEIFGRDLAQQSTPELSNLYLTFGWGQPELVKFNPNPFSATIRIFNSFECSGQKSTKPHSYFIRGHMTGLINSMFGKNVECRETKCAAMGDEYCEFIVSEKQEAE